MKSMSLLFFCFVFVLRVHAQSEDLLPTDERGKFIYYEVVPLTSASSDSLAQRALAYFKKQKNLKLNAKHGDTAFVGQGKMVVQKTLLVMSHPSGEILYRFEVELRNGKYRFWLSDFNFVPYQRDRYGNFVALTGIAQPLEEAPDKLSKAQWTAYQEQAAAYAKAWATAFKQHMANANLLPRPLQAKKTVFKNW